MKASFILNAKAGTLLLGADSLVQRITDGCNARDIESDIVLCEEGEMHTNVQLALKNNPDVIVAGGGDGTIGAVVNAMNPWSVPLGILPLGTFNHFAKDVGIPLDLDAALDVIANGKVQKIDLGEVNGKFFLNNSSIGLYTTMVRHRDEQREVWGRKKLHAMLRAFLHTMHRFPLISVSVKTDEHAHVYTSPFVFVGNNDYQMSLFELKQRSSLNHGELSLYILKCDTRYRMIRMIINMLLHRLNQERDFILLHSEEVKIEMMRSWLDVALDGEIHRMALPLSYSIRPRVLSVLLPSSL